jgi:hypothetical protein
MHQTTACATPAMLCNIVWIPSPHKPRNSRASARKLAFSSNRCMPPSQDFVADNVVGTWPRTGYAYEAVKYRAHSCCTTCTKPIRQCRMNNQHWTLATHSKTNPKPSWSGEYIGLPCVTSLPASDGSHLLLFMNSTSKSHWQLFFGTSGSQDGEHLCCAVVRP